MYTLRAVWPGVAIVGYHRCHPFIDLETWPKGGAHSPWANGNVHIFMDANPYQGHPSANWLQLLGCGCFLGTFRSLDLVLGSFPVSCPLSPSPPQTLLGWTS